MYFKLNPEIIVAKEADQYTVTDLILGTKTFLRGSSIEEFEELLSNKAIKMDLPDAHIIHELIEKNLGSIYEEKVFVEELKTTRVTTLKYDKLVPFHLNRIVIELTGECNLNCEFCNESEFVYRSCGCKKWPNKKNLDFNEWREVLNQAIKLGVKECFITGGEPLLEKEILQKVITFLTEHGINITLFTNATLLDQEMIYLIKRNHVTLALQLFGNDLEAYTRVTGDNKTYEKVKQAMDLISQEQIAHNISIIVCSLNEKFINRVKQETNTQYIYIYPTNSFYSRDYLHEMYNPSSRQIPINIHSLPYMKRFNNCLYGQIFVSSEGKVFPCMMMRQFQLGDLNLELLWEVFFRKSHKPFWEMSKTQIQGCSECPKNVSCFDCRALDSFTSGKLDGMQYCEHLDKGFKLES
ncbi:radical SAM protein [Paenibacillus barcinonensis]|uniref:radical SAM/SPASM domain-containing protein n=1 Tax=Paenibacillus barcinonensis TaxID=198119 RepID=UPI001C1010BC|nr:radical SAM protein [Paenibacillus barcinonensis]MBU5352725.1 radical SAM protein [Paenibacillus barcinonensis]